MIVIAGIGAAFPARAVDLVNRDRTPHEVIVNRTDGSSTTLTLTPGQRVADVCSECVILVGNNSVETKGRVTVKIEGGKVSVDSRR